MSGLPVLPESLYELRFIEDPRISPDGSKIAFVIRRADPDRNADERQIWMVSADGNEPPRAFSRGGAEDYAPRWSPDTRQLAFVSTRDGSPQLYTMPMEGGEPTCLTDRQDGVSDPTWSPDGVSIAFVSRATAEDRTLEDEGVVDRLRSSRAVRAWQDEARERNRDPRVVEQLPYRTRQEYFDHRYRHVYVIPASGGEPRRITHGDYHHSEPDWTPDGRWLVVNSKREQSSGEELYELWSTILRIDVESGEEEIVVSEVSQEGRPVRVSPDGKFVAHVLVHKVDSPYQHPYDVAVSPMKDGTPHAITDEAELRVSKFEWDKDGEHLIVTIHERGDSKLARLHRNGGIPTSILDEDAWVDEFDLSNDGQFAVCSVTAPLSPSKLLMVELESGERKELVDPNEGWTASHALSAPQELWYKGAGDLDVQGWFMYPKDFDAELSYPVAVEIHGGPQIMWGNTFWHEFQLLASRGYFVFFCNPRGSVGYGTQFQLERKKGGYTDVPDILAGLDELLKKERAADEDRVVVTGGSYGGFLTGWIVGHSDRFQAAVAQRGVYDQLNMFGSGDVPECVEWYHDGLPREENLMELWEYSPAAYADRVTTPTLLLHSELDYRVPVSQVETFFTALRRHGNRDAVMVRYPREGHELSRSGKPRHRIDRLHRIVDWFDRHVQPGNLRSDPLPPGAIKQLMTGLAGWSLRDGGLFRAVGCGRFEVALHVASQVADVARDLDRHPTVYIDGETLQLGLSTEGQGVSEMDYALARMLNLCVFHD